MPLKLKKSLTISSAVLRSALLFFVCVLLSSQVYAVAIGVNRASINFQDVLRSGYARETVTITTDSEELLSGELLLYGEEQEWLNFSSRTFNFSRDAPYELIVEARPPADARIQSYRVNMSILTGELSRSSGGLLGTATRASLGVPIFLQMTGTERLACQVAGLRVLDAERGRPVQVLLTVLNRGNVRVNPDIEIEVFDKLQENSLAQQTLPFGSSVLPTLSEERYLNFPFTDLDRSQYWARISVPVCGYTNIVSFDVLEVGEIKDDGDFIRIDAASWAKTGDIIPINAVFRNRGVRSVTASFKGTIARIDNDEIVKVVDTEKYLVDPSVTANIETFFNPTEPGQYMVSGRILYNDKLTVEKSTVINVNGSGLPDSGSFSMQTLLLLLMFLVIIWLLFLIIKRRREQQRRF